MFAQAERKVQTEEKEELENEWILKPCDWYHDEYKDCRAIKSRFYQYFVFGKFLDCTQWKVDCDNCYKWKDNGNIKAREELVTSEKERRMQRLRPHYTNDVWERRDKPPEDWNKPLPEYKQQEYQMTYLNLKAKELNGEIAPTDNTSYCSIM